MSTTREGKCLAGLYRDHCSDSIVFRPAQTVLESEEAPVLVRYRTSWEWLEAARKSGHPDLCAAVARVQALARDSEDAWAELLRQVQSESMHHGLRDGWSGVGYDV